VDQQLAGVILVAAVADTHDRVTVGEGAPQRAALTGGAPPRLPDVAPARRRLIIGYQDLWLATSCPFAGRAVTVMQITFVPYYRV
jgi:hypothetical protein